MLPISVIIPCFNEAHNIKALLETVTWADEIILVDSFSTDNTLEIAKAFPIKVLQRAYQYPAEQKNWAIPQAANDWILILDADERVTPELKAEIQSVLSGTPDKVGYWIGRKNFFMGKEVRYSGWQSDKVIRLIHKAHCKYEDKLVHEEITADGPIGMLEHRMTHNTYREITHFLEKVDRYAGWSAQDYNEKTGRITLYHLLIKPIFRFIKHYVFKLGFLDGRVGLIISSIMAWSVFLRYVKMMELRKDN